MAFNAIQPRGIFQIMKGIPWHEDYKHVLLFSGPDKQYQYFQNKVAFNFSEFTYVKTEKVVRVPIKADSIYNCNYCCFQNVGFGDKLFYAFITNVEYINNETSALTIEIDYFQTWFLECKVGTCFVEREHVANDTVGLHTVDEGIYFGDNYVQNVATNYFTNWHLGIIASPNQEYSIFSDIAGDKPVVDGTVVANQYMLNTFDAVLNKDNEQDINDFLTDLAGKFNIIDLYYYPAQFNEGDTKIEIDLTKKGVGRPSKFVETYISENEYTPKNNKLLCYPYCKLVVDNNQGTSLEFKYENFAQGDIYFSLWCNIVNGCSCDLRPITYEFLGNRQLTIPISDFPHSSWSENDANYKALHSSIKSAIGALTNPTPIGLANDIGQMINNGIDALTQLPEVHRSTSDKQVDIALGSYGYTFYQMTIKVEYAQILDDYFTRFGYKINRYKVPELTSRATFNYVKTRECNVTGNAPLQALKILTDMFNSGVTLWHSASSMGDYSANNSIV